MEGGGFNVAIRIVPRVSRQLELALLGLHGGIILLALGVFAAGVYGVLLVVASLLHWQQWRRELAAPVRSGEIVLFDSDGAWWVQRSNGERIAARLSGGPLVMTWLVVLPVQAEDRAKPCRLLLLSDNLPADDFRRLRVRLLWSSARARS